MELPKKYDSQESEPRLQKFWEENKVFAFDSKNKDKEVYSVDTPPPTISGKLHIGHAFSYSQQDIIVRYHRMRQKNVFYPFGTDNNGVATERLIEKMKGVKAKKMGRQEFVKLCLETVHKELIPDYVNDMKRLGISCDFDLFYDTIQEHPMRISQKSFIDLYRKGREYRKDAPTMWCPHCHTGISQVETEDKEIDSFFNDIIFQIKGEEGKEQNLVIGTTRPELLPACVAIFFHPGDERYKKYKGKKAKVPLFDFEVPIMPDERADPTKGTGIVMCCTFGDQTDMEWQKAYDLPIKMVLSKEGIMTDIAKHYKGLSVHEARNKIIDDLKENNLLIKQEPIKHTVNVHERCGTEIEFIKSKQWFVKYLDLKDEMIKWGEELSWFPEHMRVRYNNWINGLQWDWLISRQRFFGVPFPVWYCEKCEEVILANEKDLPVDPLKDKPPVSKCPKCYHNNLIPEKDVMDTWATSSLTPQIAAGLIDDEEMQKKIYPMSLRPQAHDIITFWLFNTVVKSRLHNNVNPWKDVAISGHAQDSHGKKMSKSKGEVIEPQKMIKKYSADALRFWAATSRLGDDVPFQEKELFTGQKFITKLWNASKFSVMHLDDYNLEQPNQLELMDKWLLSKLSKLTKNCTENFDKYRYYRIKIDTEQFFWKMFCDNYLEIVKDRLYNPEQRGKEQRKSAQFALYRGLISVLKLMAPIMPFITEEIYLIYFKEKEKEKSIHVSKWPEINMVDEEIEKAGDLAIEIIELVRKEKSEKNVSLKTELEKLTITADLDEDLFNSLIGDLKATTRAKKIVFEKAKEFSCSMIISEEKK